MKVFAIVFVACVVGVLADVTDDEKNPMFHDECVAESNVERGVLNKLRHGVWEMNDSKLQCFMKCMMMKAKVMKDDGSFDIEAMKKRNTTDFPAENVLAAIKKCTATTAANPCEKAMIAMKCFSDETDVLISQGLYKRT